MKDCETKKVQDQGKLEVINTRLAISTNDIENNLSVIKQKLNSISSYSEPTINKCLDTDRRAEDNTQIGILELKLDYLRVLVRDLEEIKSHVLSL